MKKKLDEYNLCALSSIYNVFTMFIFLSHLRYYSEWLLIGKNVAAHEWIEISLKSKGWKDGSISLIIDSDHYLK